MKLWVIIWLEPWGADRRQVGRRLSHWFFFFHGGCNQESWVHQENLGLAKNDHPYIYIYVYDICIYNILYIYIVYWPKIWDEKPAKLGLQDLFSDGHGPMGMVWYQKCSCRHGALRSRRPRPNRHFLGRSMWILNFGDLKKCQMDSDGFIEYEFWFSSDSFFSESMSTLYVSLFYWWDTCILYLSLWKYKYFSCTWISIRLISGFFWFNLIEYYVVKYWLNQKNPHRDTLIESMVFLIQWLYLYVSSVRRLAMAIFWDQWDPNWPANFGPQMWHKNRYNFHVASGLIWFNMV